MSHMIHVIAGYPRICGSQMIHVPNRRSIHSFILKFSKEGENIKSTRENETRVPRDHPIRLIDRNFHIEGFTMGRIRPIIVAYRAKNPARETFLPASPLPPPWSASRRNSNRPAAAASAGETVRSAVQFSQSAQATQSPVAVVTPGRSAGGGGCLIGEHSQRTARVRFHLTRDRLS